jgi:hypothetical protein
MNKKGLGGVIRTFWKPAKPLLIQNNNNNNNNNNNDYSNLSPIQVGACWLSGISLFFEDFSTDATDLMDSCPPWEADSHSASQERPRILWSPKFNYQVCKSLLSVLFLN